MKKELLSTIGLISFVFSFAQATKIDNDGNIYNLININSVYWISSNYEGVSYSDGTPIPQITSIQEWTETTSGAWCYKNFENNGETKLYNGYAILGIHDNDPNTPNKQFFPTGFRIPTSSDYHSFTNFFNNNEIISSDFNFYELRLSSTRDYTFYSDDFYWLWTLDAENLNIEDLYLTSYMLPIYAPISFSDNNVNPLKSGLSVRLISSDEPNFYGDIKFNGDVSLEDNQLKNVAPPIDPQDAINKSFLEKSLNDISLDKILTNNNDAEGITIRNIGSPYGQNDATPKIYVDELIHELQTQILFLKSDENQFLDIDQNEYSIVNIGKQLWAGSNSEVTRYSDGTSIPYVTDPAVWSSLTIGAWCYINNDPNKGKLYNWYAIEGIHDNDPNTPNKKLAPYGWKIPSLNDINYLKDFLRRNGFNYDSSINGYFSAKSIASQSGWMLSNNIGAVGNEQFTNNSTGMNLFPSGYRSSSDGSFGNSNIQGSYWLSNYLNEVNAYTFYILYSGSEINSSIPNKGVGAAVRFIKE